MKVMREDQQSVCRSIWIEIKKGLSSLLNAPTGWGKTFAIASITSELIKRGKKVLIIVDRTVLSDQTVNEFTINNLAPIKIEGHKREQKASLDLFGSVFIATSQLLGGKRFSGKLEQYFDPKEFVVFVDECHVIYNAHKEFASKGYQMVGITATAGSFGLADLYHQIISTTSPADLIESGTWKKPFVYTAQFADSNFSKKRNGDYVLDDEAVERLYKDKRVLDDTVTRWASHVAMGGYYRKTLIVACNISQANSLAELYLSNPLARKLGVEIIHSKINANEIEESFERYKSGKSRILISVDMIGRGFDDPESSLLMLYRPTKSWMLAYQIFGRVMRRYLVNGLPLDAIIIDCTGLVYCNPSIGLPMSAEQPELLSFKPENGNQSLKEANIKADKNWACKSCGLLTNRRICEMCGSDSFASRGEKGEIVEKKGDLIMVNPDTLKQRSGETKTQHRARTHTEQDRLEVVSAFYHKAGKILSDPNDHPKRERVAIEFAKHFYGDSDFSVKPMIKLKKVKYHQETQNFIDHLRRAPSKFYEVLNK